VSLNSSLGLVFLTSSTTFTESYCETAQRDILEEVKMMKRIGSHPNIVNMLGCVTQSVPLMLLVEFVSGGDLLTYLRRQRPDRLLSSVTVPMNAYTPEPKRRNMKSRTQSRSRSQSRERVKDEEIDDDVFTEKPEKPEKPKKNPLPSIMTTRLSFQDLTNLARQIALGMNYLGSKGVIHRDLACRNVLVDGSSKQVKVSDFGLARAVYKDAAYVTTKRGFLPLKWMSVEAIFDRVFTTSSDVWSFGVVLWEICTLGGIPYPCVDDDLLANKLREGYRMSRPENCSDELYEIMKRCWHPEPNHRPTFQDLSSWLDGLNPLGMRNSSDGVMPWVSASDVDSNMSSPNPSVS
jgi:serine/threonine protein kinase